MCRYGPVLFCGGQGRKDQSHTGDRNGPIGRLDLSCVMDEALRDAIKVAPTSQVQGY